MRPLQALTVLILSLGSLGAADLAPPPPPADFTLVSWPTVVDYFQRADAASDRVVVKELGKTTEGRPYLAAFVSSPETIADLDRYKAIQKALAQPGGGADPKALEGLIVEGKPVVLITCSIHSSETASTFMAMKLLHELATEDTPSTKEILANTILILVPSANPDGVDLVAEWYERTRGKPWEGSGMPRLYHKYAGHDTNRDWFMLNLKETQLLTRLLYKEWFPTIAYDVHQMGSRGARLFVPPFYDPINPNLDSRIHQSIAIIGSHMAADLAAEGKTGILTHAMYDNWWNGGNRTTPQRHNIVAVLTEAASVRMASPIFLDASELRGASRGFANHEPAVNFVSPWPGGWWRLADIEAYERTCARSLLTLAARYRSRFQGDYLAMGQAAISKGKNEPPFAWVVPSDQKDPGTASAMVRILQDTGVQVHRARAPITLGDVRFPAGSYVMLAEQPYRSHLKDMMERQVYPPRFSGSGEAEAPYDVAGWTLPLQMGVKSATIDRPFAADLEQVDVVKPPSGRVEGDRAKAKSYLIANRSNDDFRVLNVLLDGGIVVKRIKGGTKPFADGMLWFEPGTRADQVLDEILPRVSTVVKAIPDAMPRTVSEDSPTIRRKIGVYQPWAPSMDEGWTRLVLENFGFPYQTLHDADIRAGGLRSRVDTLVLASIDARTLREGYSPNETEPQYVGGLGREGVEAIRKFVGEGGTLVCLEDSCTFAIESLALPVTNVVKGLKSSEFYGPGSVVKVRHTPADSYTSLTQGMDEEGSAYFDRSLAFEVPKNYAPYIATKYAATDVLESGWLLGEAKIRDRAAVLDLPVEKGRVVLFGFPPQHRGQPHGTFRLLFNSLLR